MGKIRFRYAIENKIVIIYFFIFLLMIFFAIKCEISNKYSDELNCIHNDSKPNVCEVEPIKIYCKGLPTTIEVGDKVNININSILNEKNKTLKSLIYYIDITKDGKKVSNGQVTLMNNSKIISCNNGKFEIAREKEVVENKKYSFTLIFKDKGHYDFKIYAENY